MAASEKKRLENGTEGAPVKQKRLGIKQSGAKRSTESKSGVRKPSKTQERKAKMRSQRERDNIPLSKPFYTEASHGDDSHAEDLNTIRKMWELPATCHILWLLQEPLKLQFSNCLLDYEIALIKPTCSILLDKIVTKLLMSESRGTKAFTLDTQVDLEYEFWSQHLEGRYKRLYDHWHTLNATSNPASSPIEQVGNGNDTIVDPYMSTLSYLGAECPFKTASFADLSIEMRCKVLYNLCDSIANESKFQTYLQQMEEDDLRIEPFGYDRVGNAFYFFPEFYHDQRIYRLKENGQAWDLWVKGEASFREMLNNLEHLGGRKARGEQDLIEHLRDILEQYEAEGKVYAKQVELANRKAILDAMPRKKSLRLRAKYLTKIGVKNAL